MPAMNLATDPSGTHGKGTESPFLSLPPEMRNRIYEYVMTVGTIYVRLQRKTGTIRAFVINDYDAMLSQHDRRHKVIKGSFSDDHDSAQQPAGGGCLALLRTCKQVNKEAAKLFIVCNSFEVQAFDSISDLDDVLVNPGLYRGYVEVKSIVAAVPQFIATIGNSDAELLKSVVLHLGQFDTRDAFDREPQAIDTIKEILDHLRCFQTFNPCWHLKLGMALRIDLSEKAKIIEFEELVLDVRAPFSGVKAASEAVNDRARPLVPKSYVADQLDDYGSFLGKFQEAAETWDE
ncbi:hypothetical protein LTR15_005640 [Elasticomyces elasticus]|nr:hypothetical protein LTR15_005640 [Elasticomyces elasticus]